MINSELPRKAIKSIGDATGIIPEGFVQLKNWKVREEYKNRPEGFDPI